MDEHRDYKNRGKHPAGNFTDMLDMAEAMVRGLDSTILVDLFEAQAIIPNRNHIEDALYAALKTELVKRLTKYSPIGQPGRPRRKD